ncbi:MAG: NosD domain-containing protein [Thermoplasmata archaeon]
MVLGSSAYLVIPFPIEKEAKVVPAISREFFTPHEPIKIESDADIVEENGVIGGDGSPENPYIIGYWRIEGENQGFSITITNTTKHVVIKMNIVCNSALGILIENATNITVEKNFVYGCNTGIKCGNSTELVICNNTCLNITFTGFELLGSSGCVFGNTAIRCYTGFYLYAPRDYAIKFYENTAASNYKGVELTSTLEVNSNIVVFNRGPGVAGWFGCASTISLNKIAYNGVCWFPGVGFSSACGTIFHHNVFIENNASNPGTYMGWTLWDDGAGGNYWWDWLEPDNNGDGIVDIPRVVVPGVNETDHFPLTEPPELTIIPMLMPTMNFSEEVIFRAEVIASRSAVKNVAVSYKTFDEENYISIEMERTSGNESRGNYTAKMMTHEVETILEYYYSAVAEDGSVKKSPVYRCLVNGPPCPPLNLTSTVCQNKVFLRWNSPSSTGLSSLSGYHIYRGLSIENKTILCAVDADTTTFVDSNVTPGITYYYHVTAVNAIGESEPSNTVSATPGCAPSPPRTLLLR